MKDKQYHPKWRGIDDVKISKMFITKSQNMQPFDDTIFSQKSNKSRHRILDFNRTIF